MPVRDGVHEVEEGGGVEEVAVLGGGTGQRSWFSGQCRGHVGYARSGRAPAATASGQNRLSMLLVESYNSSIPDYAVLTILSGQRLDSRLIVMDVNRGRKTTTNTPCTKSIRQTNYDLTG